MSKQYYFECVKSLLELEERCDEISSLASRSFVDNPFFEPWFLIPAWRNLGSKLVEAVFVYQESQVGLRCFYPRICLPRPWCLVLWRHIYAYLSSPLFVKELTHWPCPDNRILSGDYIDSHSLDLFDSQSIATWSEFSRRFITRSDMVNGSAREVLLTTERQKDLRRKEKQFILAGGGEVEILSDIFQLSDWVEEFISLEASGWKGKQGTAFASDLSHTRFFRELCLEAAKSGRLFFSRLNASGARTIAMRCGVNSLSGHFAFKSAYNEDWGRFSPGMILELASIDSVFGNKKIDFIDSCAAPNATLFERLYPKKRSLKYIWIFNKNIINVAKVFMRRSLQNLKKFYGQSSAVN
jgi:hypothetical protein